MPGVSLRKKLRRWFGKRWTAVGCSGSSSSATRNTTAVVSTNSRSFLLPESDTLSSALPASNISLDMPDTRHGGAEGESILHLDASVPVEQGMENSDDVDSNIYYEISNVIRSGSTDTPSISVDDRPYQSNTEITFEISSNSSSDEASLSSVLQVYRRDSMSSWSTVIVPTDYETSEYESVLFPRAPSQEYTISDDDDDDDDVTRAREVVYLSIRDMDSVSSDEECDYVNQAEAPAMQSDSSSIVVEHDPRSVQELSAAEDTVGASHGTNDETLYENTQGGNSTDVSSDRSEVLVGYNHGIYITEARLVSETTRSRLYDTGTLNATYGVNRNASSPNDPSQDRVSTDQTSTTYVNTSIIRDTMNAFENSTEGSPELPPLNNQASQRPADLIYISLPSLLDSQTVANQEEPANVAQNHGLYITAGMDNNTEDDHSVYSGPVESIYSSYHNYTIEVSDSDETIEIYDDVTYIDTNNRSPSVYVDDGYFQSLIRHNTDDDDYYFPEAVTSGLQRRSAFRQRRSAPQLMQRVFREDTAVEEALHSSCSICLDDIDTTRGSDATGTSASSGIFDDYSLSLTPCRHTFHYVCLYTWLKTGRGSCPLCRTKTRVNQCQVVCH